MPKRKPRPKPTAKPTSKSEPRSRPKPNGTRITPLHELPADLQAKVRSFQRTLAARNMADRTIQTYTEALRVLGGFLVQKGFPTSPEAIQQDHIEEFLRDLRNRGYLPATVSNRYRSLQAFFGWLQAEEEIDKNPMARMVPPAVPEVPVPVIPGEDLSKLLGVCEGKSFRSRRDKAMVLLFVDTGMRLSELARMNVEDVDLDRRQVFVIGKGSRPRNLPIGKKTSLALDRYLTIRKKHQDANADNLWLGLAGPMTPSGVADAIDRIARKAGVQGIHPHMFRHTFAHMWLYNDGNEGDLLTIAGWHSRSMLDRYGKSAARLRAMNAHRKLSPADSL